MAQIFQFPTPATATSQSSNIGMTLTRNINGLTVSINLAKLTKEELLEALMPIPSQNRETKKEVCDKLALVQKYINQ